MKRGRSTSFAPASMHVQTDGHRPQAPRSSSRAGSASLLAGVARPGAESVTGSRSCWRTRCCRGGACRAPSVAADPRTARSPSVPPSAPDPQTLFQAASISKVVTGRHRAAPGRAGSPRPRHAGERDAALVGPARRPERGARHAAPAAQPSRRHRRSPGFPGYAVGVAAADAGRRSSTARRPPTRQRCRVAWPPGEAFRYSGGGTMVLQRLVMDAAAAGLRRAGARARAGAGRHGAAAASSSRCPPAEGDWSIGARPSTATPCPAAIHVYPEHAAAGLWSTPVRAGAAWRLAISARAGATGGLRGSVRPRETLATRVADGPTGARPLRPPARRQAALPLPLRRQCRLPLCCWCSPPMRASVRC